MELDIIYKDGEELHIKDVEFTDFLLDDPNTFVYWIKNDDELKAIYTAKIYNIKLSSES